MKTIHKAFLFAALAAFVVVLAVLPADDSSAATGVQVANSGEGSTWVQVSFDEEIDSVLVLTVYDSDKEEIDNVELPNVDGMTVYTFLLNERLDTSSTYYITVLVGGQTYYSDLDGTAVQPALRYIVVVDESENGTVEADPVFGVSGTEVTLTVDPDDGYALETLEVAGTDVTSQVKDGTYTFDLTADTSVSASFGSTVEYSSDIAMNARYANERISYVIASYDGKAVPSGTVTLTYYVLEDAFGIGMYVPRAYPIDSDDVTITYTVGGTTAYGYADVPSGVDVYSYYGTFSSASLSSPVDTVLAYA